MPVTQAPLLLTLGLLGSSAWASPKVGDRAIYDMISTQEGRTRSFTSVTELVRYDDDSQCYLERETKKNPGQPDEVRESWRGASEMLNDEKVEQVLHDCAEAGGRRDIVTVPAGIFRVCVLPVDSDEETTGSGQIWIGRVPFGIVRRETTFRGETTVLRLRSYH